MEATAGLPPEPPTDTPVLEQPSVTEQNTGDQTVENICSWQYGNFTSLNTTNYKIIAVMRNRV